MKRILIISSVFAILALSSCGSRRDRCPSVGKVQAPSNMVMNNVV